ncbi:hypothetical protein [Capnocytophaga sp. oral taxon 323]|jgi:hypothetical protein|uniref:hypothetical protein n=1 Tax=Capnocytophaga sp. oral taxon 323 TaxID=1705617 RepID=UPI0006AE1CEE|nr:hypothetical protein [Capnocytophaga sp. oral taxon 323]ALC97838.1 hypothetical protein AM608_09415 [Capnocytophaga sp. oral taxon 323]
MKDILLKDNDLEIIGGDFVIGESELQEVALLLQLYQGNLKSDPLVGINAVEWVQAKHDPVAIEKRVKVQLERDGKDYERIKKQIKISNGQPL